MTADVAAVALGTTGAGGWETVPLDAGACVISIDTELAWGMAHRRDGSAARHRFEDEREVVDRILELFARYEIPATWAIVGHLFLDRCECDGDRPHPELVTPRYAWLDEDWLAIDPCSDLERAPFWYGRDIVDAIVSCPVPQEVASHGFTHVVVDDPACTPEVFASELRAAVRVAGERGLALRSFVYPRNAIAQIPLLAEHGFRCYRGGRPVPPFAGAPAWRRRALALVDTVRPLRGSAVLPARHPSGVWNVPQTYLFAPVERGGRLPPAVGRRPIARLRQAARHRSLFHLWFHPYNVTADPAGAGRARPGLRGGGPPAGRGPPRGRDDGGPRRPARRRRRGGAGAGGRDGSALGGLLVGADQAVHAEEVALHGPQQAPHVETGLEVGLPRQGQQPEVVRVAAVARRGLGPEVDLLALLVGPGRVLAGVDALGSSVTSPGML